MLPTEQQILELHRAHAKSDADFQLIYTHCRIVETIAMQLLQARPVPHIDLQLVHIGSLLHDIGAYDVLNEEGRFVQGVRHGPIGENILRDAGYPETIWRFASHHTGVGLTEQDVIDQRIPIPVSDYTAQSDEERLIMYADKFHSKSHPPTEPPYFCTFEWYRDSVQQFGDDKIAKFDALARQFGKPALLPLSQQFGHEIKSL